MFPLKKQNKKSEQTASHIHYKVGKTIHGIIEKLAGTMSENLPAPNKSIKELENSKLILRMIILRMIFIKIDFTYIF